MLLFVFSLLFFFGIPEKGFSNFLLEEALEELITTNFPGDQVILPGHELYPYASQVYNHDFPVNPSVILMCSNEENLKSAIQVLNHYPLSFAIRSGGHSYINASCSEGFVLDCSGLNQIVIDEKNQIVEIGAGVCLGQLYHELWKKGYWFPGGTCLEVGTTGLVLGGGIGVISRKYGLACDQLVEARMIDWQGGMIRVNKLEHSDLFWALKGGGTNIGIITHLKLKIYPIENNIDFFASWSDLEEAAEVIDYWQHLISEAKDELWSVLTVHSDGIRVRAKFIGSKEEFLILFKELSTIGNPKNLRKEPGVTVIERSKYSELASVAFWAGKVKTCPEGTIEDGESACQLAALKNNPRNQCFRKTCTGRMKSGFQSEKLSRKGIKTLLYWMKNSAIKSNACVIIDSYGGKINEIEHNETCYCHRNKLLGYQWLCYFQKENREIAIKWLRDFYSAMEAYIDPNECYVNYPDLDISQETYFKDNFQRLKTIKEKYDPMHCFSRNHRTDRNSEKYLKKKDPIIKMKESF